MTGCNVTLVETLVERSCGSPSIHAVESSFLVRLPLRLMWREAQASDEGRAADKSSSRAQAYRGRNFYRRECAHPTSPAGRHKPSKPLQSMESATRAEQWSPHDQPQDLSVGSSGSAGPSRSQVPKRRDKRVEGGRKSEQVSSSPPRQETQRSRPPRAPAAPHPHPSPQPRQRLRPRRLASDSQGKKLSSLLPKEDIDREIGNSSP